MLLKKTAATYELIKGNLTFDPYFLVSGHPKKIAKARLVKALIGSAKKVTELPLSQ